MNDVADRVAQARAAASPPRIALELRDVRKRFGKTEIIRGASLQVHAGERVAIIGPNGAGKSTLFNLISGRFAPSSGEIVLNGARIDGAAPHRRRMSRSSCATCASALARRRSSAARRSR